MRTEKRAVLRIECTVLTEVKATSDDVPGCAYLTSAVAEECCGREHTVISWPVWGAFLHPSVYVSVIGVITPGVLLPSREARKADIAGREPAKRERVMI